MSTEKYNVETYAEGQQVHEQNKKTSLKYIREFVNEIIPPATFTLTYSPGNRESSVPSIIIKLPDDISKENEFRIKEGLAEKLRTPVTSEPAVGNGLRINEYPTKIVNALRVTDREKLQATEEVVKTSRLSVTGIVSQTLETFPIESLNLGNNLQK